MLMLVNKDLSIESLAASRYPKLVYWDVWMHPMDVHVHHRLGVNHG